MATAKALPGEEYNQAPTPRSLELLCLVPGCDQEELGGLSPAVVNTITQARTPSKRQLYDLKWRIFVNWCCSHGKDPQRCGIGPALSFLKEGLDWRLSCIYTQGVRGRYCNEPQHVHCRSVGKHNLVIRFLGGTQWLKPPRPRLIPSWDLSGFQSFRLYREIRVSPFSQLDLLPSL